MRKTVLVVVLLSLWIASHTVAFVAHATTWVIETATAGVVEVISPSTTNNRRIASLEADNRRINLELDDQRRANRQLTTRLDEVTDQRRVVRTTMNRMKERIRRVTIANVGSAAAESIPIIGVAVIVGATTYELKSSCDTMNDLYDIQILMDPDSATPEDRDEVCGLQVPTKEELFATIRETPGAAWDAAIGAAGDAAGWVKDIERPDFGGNWNRVKDTFSEWFD